MNAQNALLFYFLYVQNVCTRPFVFERKSEKETQSQGLMVYTQNEAIHKNSSERINSDFVQFQQKGSLEIPPKLTVSGK